MITTPTNPETFIPKDAARFRTPGSPRLNSHFRYCMLFVLFNVLFISTSFAFTANEIGMDQKTRSVVAPKAVKYQWYFNGKKVAAARSQSLPATISGQYRVETTDAAGTVKTYDATIQVNPTGIRKVYIIGDSTVMTYSASWYPWGGWGAFLPYFFDTTLNLGTGEKSLQFENRAIGGRSSKSFYNEGRWAQVLTALLPGDVYMIQFGHNDRDWTKADRYADTATYKEYLRKYIEEGRLKGAHPILVTPMNMNTWFCDVMRNVFREGANNYRGAMLHLGKEMNVPVIDLEAKSDALFEKLGRDYTTHYLFNNLQPGEYPNYPNGYSDFTHFQEMGAIEMSKLVLEGLKEHAADTVIADMLSYLVKEYKVTVTSKNPAGGLVTRSNTFPKGLTVTLKGMANPTHKFDSWTDEQGATVTNRHLFSFVMDTVDRSFSVNFKETDVLPLQSGIYRFYNAGSLGKTKQLLEVLNNSTSNGAAVVQNPGSGRTSQQWNLKHVGNGYYTLLAVHSGKSMDVSGNSLADGARVVQYTPNPEARNQQFKLVKIADNTYHLVARHSGKYLQTASGNCAAGLVQATYNPENVNQRFVLELVSLKQPAIARAANPSPVNGAPVVAPENVTLQWTGDAQAYNVYMGSSPDSLTLKASGLTTTSLALDSLSALGQHFWRVDALRDGQSEIGDTWSYTVKDTLAPVAKAQDITVTLQNGTATVAAGQVDAGSHDAYGIARLELNKATFDCSNIGSNEVVLTVTDTNGNQASAKAVVTVAGSLPAPAITVSRTDKTHTGGDAQTIFLGYGAQNLTLTAANSDGQAGFRYKWSPATQLSSDTVAAPVFSPTAAGQYTLTVTSTNQYGCTATASVTIKVIDARCGSLNEKVLVCHTGQMICIGSADVASHLAHGCSLAQCSSTAPAARRSDSKATAAAVETMVEAYPNPTAGQTQVNLAIAETGAYRLELYNLQGTLLKTVASGVSAGNTTATYELNAGRLPAGIYLLKLKTEKQTVSKRIVVQR